MYAVFVDSGTQFCVEEGERLMVDLRDVEAGSAIEFANVLLVGGGENGPVVGTPSVAGAKVVAEVVGEASGPKLHIGFYKKRKNYRRHRGHRQRMVELRIKQIVV